MMPRRVLAALLAGVPTVVGVATACIVLAAVLVMCGAQAACARDDAWSARLRDYAARHATITEAR